MTMEDNKLIAEFMGYEVKHGKCYSPKYNDGTIAPMQFDGSWDWLMPVVQKIERQNELIGAHILSTDIDKTYHGVVKFIKEVNENTKSYNYS
jgi:hypothetical protein